MRLLGAAACAAMLSCLGVLPGSIVISVIAVAPAAAQQGDLDAILRRFSELYAAGNYVAALVEAQKLEAGVNGRFGITRVSFSRIAFSPTKSTLRGCETCSGSFARAPFSFSMKLTTPRLRAVRAMRSPGELRALFGEVKDGPRVRHRDYSGPGRAWTARRAQDRCSVRR